MRLWLYWYDCVACFYKACKRKRTFFWLVLALLALSIRPDIAGVTSFIRVGIFQVAHYYSLLHLFHTKSLQLDRLTDLWAASLLKIFIPLKYRGFLLVVADGIKIPKEGKRMPGVKSLHQSSSSNSKPTYIMGHSFQALALLVRGCGRQVIAVPIVSRIHEGIVLCNANRKSLLDKLIDLLKTVLPAWPQKVILIADAYYASRKVVLPLLSQGNHLVTRVKTNCVGFLPAEKPEKNKRGRPKIYGDKIRLKDQWDLQHFVTAPSPVYNEKGVKIRYRILDILWRPVGRTVRFVLVDHPNRGKIILMTTWTSMSALRVIRLYGNRFKIEVSFKSAVNTIGSYAYHFWMKTMPKIKKGDGDQHIHKMGKRRIEKVLRKLDAYHRFVQCACIAQGVIQSIGIRYRRLVWHLNPIWLRTMNHKEAPSEQVVARTLEVTLNDFLLRSSSDHPLKKIAAKILGIGAKRSYGKAG